MSRSLAHSPFRQKNVSFKNPTKVTYLCIAKIEHWTKNVFFFCFISFVVAFIAANKSLNARFGFLFRACFMCGMPCVQMTMCLICELCFFDYRPPNSIRFDGGMHCERTKCLPNNAINSIENQWMKLVWICRIHAEHTHTHTRSTDSCYPFICYIHSIIAKILLLAMILKVFERWTQGEGEHWKNSSKALVGGRPNVTIFH